MASTSHSFRRRLTSPVSILTAALALIEQGWTKHAMHFENGRGEHSFCSAGAVLAVSRTPVQSEAALGLLKQANRIDNVIDWNDRTRTTKSNVITAFKRAISRATKA